MVACDDDFDSCTPKITIMVINLSEQPGMTNLLPAHGIRGCGVRVLYGLIQMSGLDWTK